MAIDLISELHEVRRLILSMAETVERRVEIVIEALLKKDISLAREVREGDAEIDQFEVDIEAECLRIFALSHPVASDLRFVLAVLRINNDLERIGDHAKSIAKRIINLCDRQPMELPSSLTEMANETRAMLSNARTALGNEDADLSRSVREDDDSVDHLQKEIFKWAHVEIPKHVEYTESVIDTLSIAQAFERIADLSTNIAEDVIFLAEGSQVRHQKAK